MPPVQSKGKYVQKYKISWETENQFKDWLRPFPGNNTRAYCAICRTDFAAHRNGLEGHAKTNKHIDNLKQDKIFQSTPKISTYVQGIDVRRKIAELKIAAFIAEHCSIKTVDHLGEVVQNLDKNSEVLSKIQIHRTKCTALILNVLSPCLLEELFEDVGDSYYSLIIDETTTVDMKKVMCIMIRYFSLSRRKVHTTFYRLLELEEGTAEHMTNILKKQLEDDHLKLENLIRIGIDGANAMIGEHNSVSSRLKNIIPHLVVIKCLPHSLHLSAEHACDVLPKNLDFLIKDSQSWFAKSTKRNINYTELHQVIADSNPKKIPKLSGTRWLARLDAINVILDQWDALQFHFNTSRCSERGVAGYKADLLYHMYICVENKLYLIFLRQALKEVISLNRLFQSDSVEPLKLFQDLNNLLFSILQSIVIPQHLEKASRADLCSFNFKNHLMPTDCINFGFYFNQLSPQCNPENLKIIKQRCKEFLVKLAEELQLRIPDNVRVLEKMCVFAPDVASSQNKEDITEIAVFFKLFVQMLTKLSKNGTCYIV